MNAMRYTEEGFPAFLKTLIEGNRFNNKKESGVTQQVIDFSISSLSDKQKYVFEKAISPYLFDKCKFCKFDIPWDEMSSAEDNGGYHQQCAKELGKEE